MPAQPDQSKRPTIHDLAGKAGVSVATVDRVLNMRLPVREGTAERVLKAAEEIGYHATSLLKQRMRERVPARTLGFLLQKKDAFYQKLSSDLIDATRAASTIRGKPSVEFIDELSPIVIADHIRAAASRCDALAVVSIDHPHVSAAIAEVTAKGVPVFAILSDLTAEARAGFIGRDNRKEGRTAAWIISRVAKHPGKVGIIVGSHRYQCQETAEISFRSYFREHAPEFTLLEPLINLEDVRLAHAATNDLMERNPDLVGLYICGGGMEGVLAAAREEVGHFPVAIVCNELVPATREALIDGTLTALISTPTKLLAERTIEAMAKALEGPAPAFTLPQLLPFELYIAENI